MNHLIGEHFKRVFLVLELCERVLHALWSSELIVALLHKLFDL